MCLRAFNKKLPVIETSKAFIPIKPYFYSVAVTKQKTDCYNPRRLRPCSDHSLIHTTDSELVPGDNRIPHCVAELLQTTMLIPLICLYIIQYTDRPAVMYPAVGL